MKRVSNFYIILLITTMFLCSYSLLYDEYLYELTYVKYLPNYKKEVPYQTFNKSGEITNLDDHPMRSDLLSYAPLYGRVLYYVRIVNFFLVPILFCLISLIAIVFLVKYRKNLHYKSLVIPIVLYIGIIIVMRNTNFFD